MSQSLSSILLRNISPSSASAKEDLGFENFGTSQTESLTQNPELGSSLKTSLETKLNLHTSLRHDRSSSYMFLRSRSLQTTELPELNITATVQDTSSNVPLASTTSITLSLVAEADPGVEGIKFFPTHFELSNSETISEPVGFLFDCLAADLPEDNVLSPPIQISSLRDPEQQFRFTADVCYKAFNEGTEVNDSGLIASENFEYIAVNSQGLKTNVGSATVNVFSNLVVGCGKIGGTPCEAVTDEEEALVLTLTGVDTLCKTASSSCSEQDQTLIFVPPLLDESIGVLSYFDPEAGEDIIITEELLTENVGGFGIFGFALPVNSFEVQFVPRENFFNLADFPICSDTSQFLCARSIEENSGILDELKCVGNLCDEGYTVQNILSNPINDCNDSFAGGCPIEIHYRLFGGGKLSPAAHTFGQAIWVRNKFEFNTTETVSLNQVFEYEFVNLLDTEVFLTDLEPGPIVFEDVDKELRNIVVEIILSSENKNIGRISLEIGGNEFIENENSLIIRTEGSENGNSLCVFNGCGIDQSITIVAPLSIINQLMERIKVQIFDGDDNSIPVELLLNYAIFEQDFVYQRAIFPLTIKNESSSSPIVLGRLIIPIIGIIALFLFQIGYKQFRKGELNWVRNKSVTKYEAHLKYQLESEISEESEKSFKRRKRGRRKRSNSRLISNNPKIDAQEQVEVNVPEPQIGLGKRKKSRQRIRAEKREIYRELDA
eukprot:snap_masked-scaffold_7-processed-gene-7.28-mRNA-1 protein AED:1.00 eAED:1.00 QI:0/-1/0/0/-1/1/1/0/719